MTPQLFGASEIVNDRTIRRPFGELDLCDQLVPGQNTDHDNRRLRFDRWRIQFNYTVNAQLQRHVRRLGALRARRLRANAASCAGTARTRCRTDSKGSAPLA
jgi:hypothetical protein